MEGREKGVGGGYLFTVFVYRACFKKIVPIGTDSGTNGRNGGRCWMWLYLFTVFVSRACFKKIRYRLWD